ncbi:sigma-70 family RNA polymerase sigma factor [Paraburkholderia sp. BL10I2N1]|uniref:sigma-70 family RNA polymerase sigma factor n=1 Tax=Paraburkholderia sp. BL10I2N1 TaxID=1938796 RepID=UPI00105E5214|nr:sigma-70 family RNA polymerase sigma factor [Paraburkholderia sp. BL10I2N1]TDN68638.1 RNA polymerase sigma-70 factor (ECF subfamily) [Paraburkholderia sp. BL10I2N1]
MTEDEIDKSAAFAASRAKLLSLAYRMLGSRAEAEDVVQDAWLKWHLADASDVRAPAGWLTTITTRLAIDRLRHLQMERASRAGGWLPEPWLDDVAPSAEEVALRSVDMSYGLLLLLERLTPDERAAFVLHEAFDCDYAEIAQIIDKSVANCRQIVHRAKARLRRAGDEPRPAVDPAAHAKVVERLRAAIEAQDRAQLMRLFSVEPVVLTDADVADTGAVIASARWVDQVVSRAAPPVAAEAVSINGATGIALLHEGEITELLDVTIEDGRIVRLCIVSSAANLDAANRDFGARAVVRLLKSMCSHSCMPAMLSAQPVTLC